MAVVRECALIGKPQQLSDNGSFLTVSCWEMLTHLKLSGNDIVKTVNHWEMTVVK